MSTPPRPLPRQPTTLRPALVGGMVAALLSMLPVLGHANLVCCLWAWVGGGLACLMRAADLRRRPSLSEAIFVGLLAGLVCAGLVVGVASLGMRGDSEAARELGRELQAELERYDPEVREELERGLPGLARMRDELLEGRASSQLLLAIAFGMLITLPHFAAAGAIVASLWLERRGRSRGRPGGQPRFPV